MRLILLLLSLFISSCADKHEKKPNTTINTEVASTTAGPSVFLSGLACQTDPSIHYSVYFPGRFNNSTLFPVLILFDPHADGNLPINLYKELADRYNFILLGSNDSRNGNSAEQTAGILQALSAQARILDKADTNLIFAGGFSGGARVAAMLALSPAGIKGLVVCGAGLPQGSWTGIPPNVIVGIAGNSDMNLIEITNFKISDPGLASRFQVVRFNGSHAWPPVMQFEQAFIAFSCIAQRDKMTSSNDTLLKFAEDRMKSYIMSSDDPIYKAEAYKRWIMNLGGLADINGVSSKLKQLITSPNYLNAVSYEKSLGQTESFKRNELMQALGSRDTLWWKDQMKSWLDTSSFITDHSRIAMIHRVQGTISLTVYMSLNRAVAATSLEQGLYFSTIYRLVDPLNPESWYLSAVVAAQGGRLGQCREYLESAIKNGFQDIERCRKEVAFAPLQSDAQFQSLINSIH